MKASELEPGRIIFSRYKITEKIGKGGMGSIYKADDLTLLRPVILKVISKGASFDSTAVMRFQNEARASSRLNHPNIAKVFDFGELDGNDLFLVMEFVDGKTLQASINEKEHLELVEVLEIFIQLCDALAHAHQEGVIHRDIKPSNIMLRNDEEGYFPVLLDFGVAKLDDLYREQHLTSTGNIVGSPLYMSPEQAGGGAITAASDQYSLGCVLHEVLTSEPPYVGETIVETLAMHRAQSEVDLSALSDDQRLAPLQMVLAKLLCKQAENRFYNMQEACQALVAICESLSSDELESDAAATPSNAVPVTFSDSSQEKSRPQTKSWLRPVIPLAAIIAACLVASAILIPPRLPHQAVQRATSINDTEPSNGAMENTYLKKLMDSHASKLNLRACMGQSLAPLKGYKDALDVDLETSGVSDQDMRYLLDSPIRNLSLKGDPVKPLEVVSQMKDLENLDLGGSDVDDASIARLVRLKMLQQILLQRTCITDRSIKYLKQMPKLRTVTLDLSESSRAELRKSLPLCHVLPGQAPPAARLLKEAEKLTGSGSYARALPLLRQALIAVERVQGPDSIAVCYMLQPMATCYVQLKQQTDAERTIERGLAISRQYGDTHMQCSLLLEKLRLLGEQRRSSEAILTARQAISLLQKCDVPNSKYLCMCLSHLANHLLIARQLPECIDTCKHALAIGKVLYGEDSHVYASTLIIWAEADREAGRYGAAITKFEKVAAIEEKHKLERKGEGNVLCAAYLKLGMCRLAANENEKAVTALEQGLSTYRDYGYADKRAESMKKLLVVALDRLGRKNEAKNYQ